MSAGYSPVVSISRARGATLSWASRRTLCWSSCEFGGEVEVHGDEATRRPATRTVPAVRSAMATGWSNAMMDAWPTRIWPHWSTTAGSRSQGCSAPTRPLEWRARVRRPCWPTMPTAVRRDARAAGTRHAADLLLRLPEFATLFSGPTMTRAVTHLLGGAVPVCDVSFRSPQPGFGGQSLHADDVPVTRADESHHRHLHRRPVRLHRGQRCDRGRTGEPPAARSPAPARSTGTGRPGGSTRGKEGPLAFIMSGHLLHRGTRNRSDAPRPALQAVWRIDVPAFALREQHAHR